MLLYNLIMDFWALGRGLIILFFFLGAPTKKARVAPTASKERAKNATDDKKCNR